MVAGIGGSALVWQVGLLDPQAWCKTPLLLKVVPLLRTTISPEMRHDQVIVSGGLTHARASSDRAIETTASRRTSVVAT